MKLMTSGVRSLAAISAALLGGISGQVAAQGCDGALTHVEGKIFNNAQAGGTPFSTLGVVAMKGDYPIGKMKCGIVGVARSPDEGDIDANGNVLPLLFTHTVSCDDDGPATPFGPTHSQLTFHTKGTFTEVPQACPYGGVAAPFVEYSAPIPGTGRGILTGANGGALTIQGTINCAGTIDMKFSGDICLGAPGA